MSFLIPILLWAIIPLLLFLFASPKSITVQTHIMILILLLIALARPIQKQQAQELSIDAREIIIAIDISRSMQAKDILPTRYLFAKETAKHLLLNNTTDYIMLFAFTSNPLLLSPPSTDHLLAVRSLESLNPAFILTKGTSLKTLFTKLSSLSPGPKTLVLMTDGGEEKSSEMLADLLNANDISLITLALGSKQGTTISQKNGTMVKDKEGNLIISRLNPILTTLTKRLNGAYLMPSYTPQKSAEEIADILESQARTQTIKKRYYRYKELYQVPLFLALLLFLLLHTRGVKYLLVFFTFLHLPLQASVLEGYYLYQSYQSYKHADYRQTKQLLKKVKTPSLQSRILLANTYFKEGDYKKAIAMYHSIKSTSASIKQQLYYNTANAYVFLHQYAKAKTNYIKSLQLGFDEDALHNLKLIIFLENKTSAPLGIAHPKSQSSQTSKSENQNKNNKREEDKPSSSSGAGTGAKQKQKKEKPHTLITDSNPQKQPLGSKVYELINKGYIYETAPW